MSDLIAKARRIAEIAHGDDLNPKSGERYIEHPTRVATYVRYTGQMLEPCDLEEAIALAWLHDTIEDTSLTREMIADQMGKRIALGVHLLSRRPGESPQTYYAALLYDPVLVVVKHADFIDNLDPFRRRLLTPRDQVRLLKKYLEGAECLGVKPQEFWGPALEEERLRREDPYLIGA